MCEFIPYAASGRAEAIRIWGGVYVLKGGIRVLHFII